MTPGPDNAPPAAWQILAAPLGGSFIARARGLLNPEIVLFDADGEPFGRLETHGTEGANFAAGEIEAGIRTTDRSTHEMTSGGEQVLTSRNKGSATTLRIQATSRAYDADLSLLRNRATARTPGDRTAARISGGLSNRRYEATFDPHDPNALPISLFLLHRLNALRSRAYQTR